MKLLYLCILLISLALYTPVVFGQCDKQAKRYHKIQLKQKMGYKAKQQQKLRKQEQKAWQALQACKKKPKKKVKRKSK